MLLTVGDVDAATRLAGVERPDPSDDDEYTDWVIELDGTTRDRGLFLRWPENINRADSSELADEIGFTLAEVSSFVEVSQLPDSFVVLDGVSTEGIDEALGERVDGLWMVGDTEEFNPDDVTALRPIGGALFVGERGGRVAYGRSRDTMSAWLEGGESLLDDAAFASVARHLDEAEVYMAIFYSPDDPSSLPDASGALDDPGYAPWSVVAVGLLPEEDPAGVIVYHHDNDDDAETNADIIEDHFRSGSQARAGTPWSEFVDVRSVDIDGNDVVVILELDRASVLYQALLMNEPVLTAGLGR